MGWPVLPLRRRGLPTQRSPGDNSQRAGKAGQLISGMMYLLRATSAEPQFHCTSSQRNILVYNINMFAFMHLFFLGMVLIILWCWSSLLRVPWTARRSNQSILKKISPEYSLEGLMLKFQYFGHLMQRTDSLEKTLMLGKTEGRRRG